MVGVADGGTGRRRVEEADVVKEAGVRRKRTLRKITGICAADCAERALHGPQLGMIRGCKLGAAKALKQRQRRAADMPDGAGQGRRESETRTGHCHRRGLELQPSPCAGGSMVWHGTYCLAS